MREDKPKQTEQPQPQPVQPRPEPKREKDRDERTHDEQYERAVRVEPTKPWDRT
jgi:hypothetical protein